jgi:hypothetical protein
MKTRITLIGLFAMLCITSNAGIRYVRSTGVDSNNGTSIASPFLTLRSALIDSTLVNGDTINVSGTISFSADTLSSVTITKSLTIMGDGASTTVVKGFDNGKKTAIFAVLADPTQILNFRDITFDGFDGTQPAPTNPKPSGALLACWKGVGTVNFKNVVIKNCKSYNGGAIYIQRRTDATDPLSFNFTDCYFLNNNALRFGTTTSGASPFGGAIYVMVPENVADISVTIDRCLFEGNISENYGAAISVYFSAVNNTRITQNLLIQNSTFTGNHLTFSTTNLSTNYAQAVIDIQSLATVNASQPNAAIKIINNTIAYNTSASTNNSVPVGLRIADKTSGIKSLDNTVSLINNILFSNLNSAATPKSISIGGTTILKESRNNITDATTTQYDFNALTASGFASGNIQAVTNSTLLLASALADNGGFTKTLALGIGSSAINAGYLTGAPTVDQRNMTRLVTGIDVGAYDSQATKTALFNPDANTLQDAFKIQDNSMIFNVSGKLRIITVSGIEIKTMPVTIGQRVELPKGLYVVNVTNELGHATQKVIL